MSGEGIRPNNLFSNKEGEDEKSDAGSEDEGLEDCVGNAPGEDEDMRRDDDDEEGEEGQIPCGICIPCRPSQAEVDKHNETHIPFRNWCEICIQGRAENYPHKKAEKEEREVPSVHMDICYTRPKEEMRNKEEKSKPILVMKDKDTHQIYDKFHA